MQLNECNFLLISSCRLTVVVHTVCNLYHFVLEVINNTLLLPPLRITAGGFF